MNSPFPGVDPFLETQGLWPDFHSKFINCLQEHLLERLPAEYDARMDERVYLMEMPEELGKLVLPDVERTGRGTASRRASESVATLEPVTIPLCMPAEIREVLICIIHRQDRELVAVIEVLLPSSKSSASRGVYLERRFEIIASPVHLIELDLLLGGERLPMARPLPPAHYYALVSRGDRRPYSDVYAWTIRDPLPQIPIPLQSPHLDVTIHLADVFSEAYRRGRYGRAIDYRKTIDAPLPAGDLAWVAGQAKTSAL